MIYAVVSVRDTMADAFGRPIFTQSVGVAIRSFSDEVNRVDVQNEMNKHPEDFELFELGTFDDNTGRFVLYDKPKSLVVGKQVIQGGA